MEILSKSLSLALIASLLVAVGSVSADEKQAPKDYVLGPDDQLIVRALDVEEFSRDLPPVRVDRSGFINLPVVGQVEAGGKTVRQLETAIAEKLKATMNDPQPTVFISEFRSQPVSVLGAVNRPGVLQVQGRKTLFEIISMAEGLKPEAGASIKITRSKEWGPIPLASAADDPTGKFSVATVSVKSVMEAKNPEENILIQPNDVISAPKAELVYVVGTVRRSGGFALAERESISVLQALALAEGLDRNAAPKKAKILRDNGPSARLELPVNIKDMLAGKAKDVSLSPNDILFVPNNSAKAATLRGIEAAISVGTGIMIYRRY